MSGIVPPIPPPLGTGTGNPSNSNINRVDMMPNTETTNASPTINVSRSVDDELLLPQLLDSRGGSLLGIFVILISPGRLSFVPTGRILSPGRQRLHHNQCPPPVYVLVLQDSLHSITPAWTSRLERHFLVQLEKENKQTYNVESLYDWFSAGHEYN
ncbi:hypothetical protein Tco_0527159 [Tanacetum coccineum]